MRRMSKSENKICKNFKIALDIMPITAYNKINKKIVIGSRGAGKGG